MESWDEYRSTLPSTDMFQPMISYVEEAFEIQTLQAFNGWVYDRICDRSGNIYPNLTEAVRKTGKECSLNAIIEYKGLEIGVLPSDDWMWSHPWLPDHEYTQCDEEGWSYGSTIARINRRLAKGTSKVKREVYHFLRRRRWIRTRVKKPPTLLHENDSEVGSSMERSNTADLTSVTSMSNAGIVVPGPSNDPPKRYYRVYSDSVFRNLTPRSFASFVIEEFTDDDIQLEGWLGHRGSFSKSWKLRYFLLRRDRSSLIILRDRASLVQVREEFIDRHTSVVIEESVNPQQFQFLVMTQYRVLRLNALDATCRADWLSAISELIVASRDSFLLAQESTSAASTPRNALRSARHKVLSRHASNVTTNGPNEHDVERLQGAVIASASHALSDLMKNGYTKESSNRKNFSKRRAWRPYKLVSSTMHSKRSADEEFELAYLNTFQDHIAECMTQVENFVITNLDIFEANLVAEEELLCNAASYMSPGKMDKLRVSAKQALKDFRIYLECQMILEPAPGVVFACNMVKRDLYKLAMKLHANLLEAAAPPEEYHATVKKAAKEAKESSLEMRRIPSDWFPYYDNSPSRSVTSEPLNCESSSVSLPPHNNTENNSPVMKRIGRTTSEPDQFIPQSKSCTSSSLFFRHSSADAKSLSQSRLKHDTPPQGAHNESWIEKTHRSISTRLSGTLSYAQSPVGDDSRNTVRHMPYVELPKSVTAGYMDAPVGVNDFVVLMHTKDLGSWIAHALTSANFVEKLEQYFDNSVIIREELSFQQLKPPSLLPYSNNGITYQIPEGSEETENTSSSTEEGHHSATLTPPMTASNLTELSKIPKGKQSEQNEKNFESLHASFEQKSDKPSHKEFYLSKLQSCTTSDVEVKCYLSDTNSHPPRHPICVEVRYAAQFHALRALVEPGNVQFLSSISKSKQWEATGGKSGAFFSMTHDKRYVLKGIPETEFNMFVDMAPQYFAYMHDVVRDERPTIISKAFGLFKLTYRRSYKPPIYIVVMENFSYGFPPGQMYDLKGILRRRINIDQNGSSSSCISEENELSEKRLNPSEPTQTVLLDGNLAERIPIPVRQDNLDKIEHAIQCDTDFLCHAGVVDYSILLMFDEEKREVVLGLIDYLHQFDFLKKMESTSKAGLTFRNPTIINPLSYKRRCVNAMHRYLVGIELELELRMRKRSYSHGHPYKSKNKNTVHGTRLSYIPSDHEMGSSASVDKKKLSEVNVKQNDVSKAPSDTSASRESTVTPTGTTPVPTSGLKTVLSGVMQSEIRDKKPPLSPVLSARALQTPLANSKQGKKAVIPSTTSVATLKIGTTRLVSNLPHTSKSPEDKFETLNMSPERINRRRGLSMSSLSIPGVIYDRTALAAHSDGEEFGSDSSDDLCLKGSNAVIYAMLPDLENSDELSSNCSSERGTLREIMLGNNKLFDEMEDDDDSSYEYQEKVQKERRRRKRTKSGKIVVIRSDSSSNSDTLCKNTVVKGMES